MPNYYRITLYNEEKDRMIVGLAKADSVFDAEEKGKEWAKHWESQGYKFRAAKWIHDFDKINEGVIYMAEECYD